MSREIGFFDPAADPVPFWIAGANACAPWASPDSISNLRSRRTSWLAVLRIDPQTNNVDIWAFDMTTGRGTAITNDSAQDLSPIWSPDGKQILYVSPPQDARNMGIYRKAGDGSGNPELLFQFTPGAGMALTDISPDEGT